MFWFDLIFDFAKAEGVSAALACAAGSSFTVRQPPREQNAWRLEFPANPSAEEAERAQGELRKVLAQIHRDGRVSLLAWKSIVRATRSASPLIFGIASLDDEHPGRHAMLTCIQAQTVSQWWAFALLELMDQNLGDRIRRCALETCGKYFVDSKAKGPDRLYCSTSHGSQDRVRRKRKRDARRRMGA